MAHSKSKEENKRIKWKSLLACVILFVMVAVISMYEVNRCIEKMEKNAGNDINTEAGTEGEFTEESITKEESETKTVTEVSVDTLEELTRDLPVVEGLYEETDKPRNPEMVAAFTKAYGGVWYLTKEYDGKEWFYRDLTKKLAIMAWNRFNDSSYQEVVGSYQRDLGELGYYYKGSWVCVEDLGYETELIYGDWVHSDGIDIKYHEEYIILTDREVDLSGIGGPVFSIEDFRYENIYGYDYLISDIYGFGLVWDGTYLEYCEPKKDNGHYQGLYAFRHYSMDSIINQDYNDD